MLNKTKYRALCEKEALIPIFSQPFWLDAVCNEENWDVLLFEKNGNILASMPYYLKKVYGITYATQPILTQTLGPWISYPPNLKYERKLSYEKEVMIALIDQLEKLPIVFFQQNFSFQVKNWLPFYWRGYQQTTKYTYRIENFSDINILFNEFHISKKRNINQANTLELHVEYDMLAPVFYNYHKLVLSKRGKRINYDLKVLDAVVNCCIQNKCGRILKLVDIHGNIHGAIFAIWDKLSSYFLISAFDPTFGHSRGSTLLFFETIKYVSQFVRSIDFEGSMDESIENSYRKFGTFQTPYFRVWKTYTKNPVLRFLINEKLGII